MDLPAVKTRARRNRHDYAGPIAFCGAIVFSYVFFEPDWRNEFRGPLSCRKRKLDLTGPKPVMRDAGGENSAKRICRLLTKKSIAIFAAMSTVVIKNLQIITTRGMN
jgi:hypothetical protein